MNDSKVKMDPLLSLSVMAAYSEEQECEHDHHDEPDQQPYHEGKAAWYMQVRCNVCQYTSGLRAVCARWKLTCELYPLAWCSGCDDLTTATVLVQERIK